MIDYKIKHVDDRIYPMGITIWAEGLHVSAALLGEECKLILFEGGQAQPCEKIPFPRQGRLGDVWNLTLEGDFIGYEYCFEVDGKQIADPYGHIFTGRAVWGDLNAVQNQIKTPILMDRFDWGGDVPLQLPYEACIIYRIHVRGFTMHSSSKCQNKGTFQAVTENIPYLKKLGITTLELMPISEFQEVMVPKGVGGNPYGVEKPTGKLNYWGYTESFLMAPKASFSTGGAEQAVTELKELVKALHRAGIELVIELFFTGEETPSFVLDTLRFWVREYHVDGIHLVGYASANFISNDAYLSTTKLWADNWSGTPASPHKNRGVYSNRFQVDMRRLLKGDEDQINNLIFHSKQNPREYGRINYIANTNGFTLMDLVSYDRKHNERNGENNQDGNDYNYSWNCGIEGASKKKKIAELRKKQIRNALVILFLSQGTPLLLSGDEFGNSKEGNNNSYCQDNGISWLNWNQLRSYKDIYEFTKYMISFRKNHPVFRQAAEPRAMDYMSCGYPDVSYHGVKAWCPEFENFRRQLGIMYCGAYGVKPDKSQDDYLFVAYNMHWEPHGFALPNIPKSMRWHVALDTDAKDVNGIYQPGKEPILENQKQFMVMSRSIVVFIGR